MGGRNHSPTDRTSAESRLGIVSLAVSSLENTNLSTPKHSDEKFVEEISRVQDGREGDRDPPPPSLVIKARGRSKSGREGIPGAGTPSWVSCIPGECQKHQAFGSFGVRAFLLLSVLFQCGMET